MGFAIPEEKSECENHFLKTDLKSLSLEAQIVLLETEKTLQEIHIFAHEDHSFQHSYP